MHYLQFKPKELLIFMTLKDIYQFFTNPPKVYLNHHQAGAGE